MACIAAAELTLDVARGCLYLADGVMTATISGRTQLAACDDRSIVLACAGDVMGATVTIENHDRKPEPLAKPWLPGLEEAVMDLPTGELVLANLDGGVVRYPDVGIAAGRWNVDVYVTGRDEALALQEEMDAAFEAGDLDFLPGLGPEHWLARFWR